MSQIHKNQNVAVLDLGTNTVLLLIAEVNPDGSYQVLQDAGEVVRLGEGIHHEPRFLPGAMQRTFDLLKKYRERMDQCGCTKVIAVGTAGFRHAKNGVDFCTKVKMDLGIDIRVISGEEEARLIYLAARGAFADLKSPLLVLDIGGGSTEFIFEKPHLQIEETSLAFGVVKLTERFLHADPPLEAEINRLVEFVNRELSKLSPEHPPHHLVATAGTPTTLSALIQNLKHYDAARVHGRIITLTQVETLTHHLAGLTLIERARIPCLPERRADVIVAGAHILICVMRHFGLNRCVVSDHGLRYGVLLEYLREAFKPV